MAAPVSVHRLSSEQIAQVQQMKAQNKLFSDVTSKFRLMDDHRAYEIGECIVHIYFGGLDAGNFSGPVVRYIGKLRDKDQGATIDEALEDLSEDVPDVFGGCIVFEKDRESGAYNFDQSDYNTFSYVGEGPKVANYGLCEEIVKRLKLPGAVPPVFTDLLKAYFNYTH